MTVHINGVEEIKDRVITYAKETVDGTLIQCEKMQWSCQRFLDDLEKTEDPDSKFYMDWEEVYKFYRWCLMFKHTKGVLAGEPVELHESQLFESANIFGFKYRRTGYRRFREAYIQKARKNAKVLAFSTGR